MPNPKDPREVQSGESEYSWGAGMFPPGIADTDGPNYNAAVGISEAESKDANYARMVADRRTDTLDPNSTRDFKALGNSDRYGAAPPLIREKGPKRRKPPKTEPRDTNIRKW